MHLGCYSKGNPEAVVYLHHFDWFFCCGDWTLVFFALKRAWGRPVVELVQRHMPGVGKSCYPQLGNCCTIQNSTENFWFAAAVAVEIIKNVFSVPESFSVCMSGARSGSCCCLPVLWPNLFISSSKLLVILRSILNKMCQLDCTQSGGRREKTKPQPHNKKSREKTLLETWSWLLWETIMIVLHLQIFHLC